MQNTDSVIADLELGMQELEPMEAPGWWTVIGISAGAAVSASAAYSGWVVSAAIVT
jgi:hypothetical protein